jgi:hypothetical protein
MNSITNPATCVDPMGWVSREPIVRPSSILACYVINSFTRLRKQERPMAIILTTTLPIFPSPAYLLVA